ncbi:WxL domain-containing protein [Lacticaseibacillus camelliae]|nr:WxL domain-containing protein [Lacticaseibacillus camelliae]
MKKGLLASALVLPILAMGMGSGTGVLAAETTGPSNPEITKTSKASVVVTPGKLELVAVPDLNFTKVSVSDIATKPYTDSRLASTRFSRVLLNDFRGDSKGWKLSAKLGNLNSGKNKINSAQMMLTLGQTGNKTMPGQLGGYTWLRAGGNSATLLATSDKSSGSGLGNYKINTTDLRIDQQEDIQAGAYTGTMTWTLASTGR